jgi:hypothetical protein
MKRDFLIAFAVLLILGIHACSPATPIQEELTPAFETTSSEPYSPLTTQTGVQPIDRVLTAVANNDMQSLRALIEFTNAECTQQDGLGGPPKCRTGEAEGTPVEVLAFLGSEGSFLRKDEIDNWTGVQAAGIYAIYEVNAAVITAEQYYPIGKYVILFVSEENQLATALRIGESGIVRVDTIFDASPASLDAMIEREALNVLLAPKS